MLTDFEKDVLRACNGEDVPGLTWGGAMSEAIESLCAGGYLAQHHGAQMIEYRITDAGKAALKESE